MSTSIGSALSSYFSSAVSKPNAATPVEVVRRPPALPEDRNPAVSADELARSYVNIAEGQISSLNRSIKMYNYYGSDEYRDFLTNTYSKSLEQVRALHGDAAAESLWTRMQPENLRAFERGMIEVSEKTLQAHFNVSGSLYTYDAETDTYGRGQFSLSVDAGDFVVKVDSARGAQISVGGSPFTSDFARYYIPDMKDLSYQITSRTLLDTFA